MSDTKVSRLADVPIVAATRTTKREDTGKYVPWRTMPPKDGETVRWQCVDDRWVTISLGHGDDAGHAIVEASDGRRERADSYEAALELARRWREP